MSLDRYLAVAHPIRSISLRTVKNANRALLILWIFILLFCIPTFITHNVSYDNSSDGVYSVCNFLTDEYNYALYQVIFCLFSYVIPILLILILYVLMLKRLWFTGIPGRNMSSESVRSKKKVTRMVVIVVIIFACCWCPIQIILVLRSFNIYQLSTTKVIIQITGQVLGEFIYDGLAIHLYSNPFISIYSSIPLSIPSIPDYVNSIDSLENSHKSLTKTKFKFKISNPPSQSLISFNDSNDDNDD